MEDNIKTGTTTVGIVTQEGVVLATEKRATMGNIIAHKDTQKLYKLCDNMGITTAGLVGDLQVLVRYLKAENELFKLKRDKMMTVKAVSTMLSNMLNSTKYMPYWVQLLVAGVDSDGSHVYSIDSAGGAIEDKYASTGSGSLFVYGILEDYYKEDIKLNDGIDIAIRGVHTAMKRDSASGDGINVATITKKEGFKYLKATEIDKRKKKMELK